MRDLFTRNSAVVAKAIRILKGAQLDLASPVPLNWDTPLTTQSFIEEHPLSHTYRKLANLLVCCPRDTLHCMR